MTINRRTEAVRILSNYLRLLATFAFGLVTVRLVAGFGDDAFSIFNLITIGVGVGVMLRELLRIALVPSLTLSYAEEADFSRIYASSWIVSAGAALFGLIIFGSVAVFLDSFSIASEYHAAALVFIAYRAVAMVMNVTLMPLFSLLYVTGRQAQANILLASERLVELLGVILALIFATGNGPAQLIMLSFSTLALQTLLYLGAGFLVLRLDQRFRPRLRLADYAAARNLLSKASWSGGVIVSMNLYLRFDILFVNIVFGTAGTLVFGIAVYLIGYLRQLTTGIVAGMDAVFAASMGMEKGAAHRPRLLKLASSLQGIIVLFSLGYMVLALEDLVWLWLSSTLATPSETISVITTLTLVMVVGMAVRSLSDVWMQGMTGVGRIDAYVRPLLIPAFANPLLVFASHHFYPEANIYAVGWCFVVLQVLAHGILLPAAASRILEIPLRALLMPFALPAVAALITTLVGALFDASIAFDSRLGRVSVLAGVFAVGAFMTLALLHRNLKRSPIAGS